MRTFPVLCFTLAAAAGVTRVSAATFESWRATHFSTSQLSDLTFSGDEADPDADGMVNLLEFALGRPPLQPDRSRLPITAVADDRLELTYLRPKSVEGLLYQVQTSFDLLTWLSGTAFVDAPVSVDAGPDWRVTVRSVQPVSALSRQFLRLRVAQDRDGNGIADEDEDQDGEGLTDEEEYQLGSNPTAADTDGDGVNDFVEVMTNHTSPTDYYNGQTPVIVTLSGTGQVGRPGYFLPEPWVVRVTDATGLPRVNAPVTFTASGATVGFSTSGGGGAPVAATLVVRTDGQGMARAYWKL